MKNLRSRSRVKLHSFGVLVKKDLKGYFDQPIGYILLIIFVSALSYFFFRDILVTKEAGLTPLFSTYLPVLMAVFVPAATMRLIAEEHRDGTLEILFTQPVSAVRVILAKFLSGFLFVGIDGDNVFQPIQQLQGSRTQSIESASGKI